MFSYKHHANIYGKLLTKKNRREFLLNLMSGLILFFLSNVFFLKRSKSKIKPKIKIRGMGIGGSNCLQYLKKIIDFVEIIVIEKKKKIRTGLFYNLSMEEIIERN